MWTLAQTQVYVVKVYWYNESGDEDTYVRLCKNEDSAMKAMNSEVEDWEEDHKDEVESGDEYQDLEDNRSKKEITERSYYAKSYYDDVIEVTIYLQDIE